MARRAASLNVSLELAIEAARDDLDRSSRLASRSEVKYARTGFTGESPWRQSISTKIERLSLGAR